MRVELSPSEGVVGTTLTVRVKVTATDEPVETGGEISLAALRKVANHWVPVQNHFPQRPNFVNVELPDGVQSALEVTDNGWTVKLQITAGRLEPCQSLALVFGDTSHGSPGLHLAALTGNALLRFSCRTAPEAESREIAEAQFTLLPDAPRELRVRTQRSTENDAFRLKAAALDRFGNTAADHPDTLSVEAVLGMEMAGPLAFPATGKALAETEVSFTGEARASCIEVTSSATDLNCTSDPLPIEQQVFWGDLHCHTRLAQALETTEFLYAYAKEDAALDFLCHVEHYCGASERWIADEEWQRWHTRPASLHGYIQDAWAHQQELVRAHYEPGRFVPLLGFEWASNLYGHMNVIYREDQGEVIYPQSFWCEADTPTSLFEKLRGRDAIVIPHHPSWPVRQGESVSGVDWSFYDPEFTRLVEICSKHGVSEFFGCPDPVFSQAPEGAVRSALNRGHRLGFVGSTDTHASRPGSWGLKGDLWAPKAGIVGVFADTLERDAIFTALRNRRCYATTGARLLLEFTVNDAPMGSEIQTSDERELRAKVQGTAGITCMEFIKNGQAIYRQTKGEGTVVTREHIDRAPPQTGDYYYLRVLQEDGHQAWSSPVWVDP